MVALVAAIVFLLFVDVSRTSSRNLEVSRIYPYILCTEGKVIVRRDDTSIPIETRDRLDLEEHDRIRTLSNSNATLFWPDGSITRISEKTNIEVNELRKEANGSTKVDFSLTEGKSWSNIVRYLDPDSHFQERFDNDTKLAAVRGTIFEINLEKNYVHTVDHAVTIEDANGQAINQVTTGRSVSTDNVLQNVPTETTVTPWSSANIQADQALATERFEAAKQQLIEYTRSSGLLERMQTTLRKWFGLPSFGLPIHMSFEGENIRVVVDTGALSSLSQSDSTSLSAIYETISGFGNSPANLDAKMAIRNTLNATLPEVERKKYQDAFARAALYESWDAMSEDVPDRLSKLRGSIQSYIEAGASAKELESIQTALPQSTIDSFNVKIDIWKARGFQTLSDGEWIKQAFQIDSTGIMKGIQNFNAAVDSLIPGK